MCHIMHQTRLQCVMTLASSTQRTPDNCEQQTPSVALRLQQLTAPAARRRSWSVYNSCGLTPSRTEGRINIRTYFLWETRISLEGPERLGRI